jgi:hypothetical protein
MPLRNRVTPLGEIVAVPARGTLMGNRGILHDADRNIVRDWQVRRWIACRLEFHGRHRSVMTPGHYTELFFLDEVAALADGHRPCAECRHTDFRAFQAAWRSVYPDQSSSSADAIDHVLHVERRVHPFLKRTHFAQIDTLPDGSYVRLDDRPWLIWDDAMWAWSPDGYVDRAARPVATTVAVLTPASIVRVLRAGYYPHAHPSCQ